ncbi:hypothetical protein ACTI_65760 [Actinoplanes sp. OR16]|uniref:sensor histidine kinase n=1 Tax=Actinoplanes sp. OR16 TaxID=946334 RepID=UPI000F711FF0|nr:sensor histidine kinase [Actinoplanes sp. OR16]BBH69891.1 hypothetical protein ACTI_65760 [Actinoplanes sp. OR16]
MTHLHETTFYDSDEQFLAVMVPFLTDGLEAGQPVVSAFGPGNQKLVRDVFGSGSGIHFVVGDAQYLRPAATIRQYRELIGSYLADGARQIRVAAEVPHPGTGAPWDWWARYEAVVNHAYRDLPVWAICPYDTRTAPDRVLAEVRRTHPHICQGGAHAVNPGFQDPSEFLTARSDTWADAAESAAAAVELVNPTSSQARAAVTGHASSLTTEERNGLLVAVSEAVSNALMYGRPPVVVRVWTTGQRVVVTVTDSGTGPSDPYAGLIPAAGRARGDGGLGLWISHQVCTYVGLQRDPDSFTVRLVAGRLP